MCRDQREIYENIKLKNPGLIAIFDLSDVGQVGRFPREKVGQVEHFFNQNFGQFNTLKMKIRDVEANRSLYIEEVHFVIMRRTLYMLKVDDTF